MATRLGLRAERLKEVRALQSVKGRRESGRFAFEGSTLLEEATSAGFPIEALYATEHAYAATPLVQRLERTGTPAYLIEAASASAISDVTTPSGIVAVAARRLVALPALFSRAGLFLVLADLGDPANVGTLLRSADAFGCAGVVVGSLGVDPYHPKVVRAAMGAVFRLALAVAEPEETAAAAAASGVRVVGLAADGQALSEEAWEGSTAVVVGHERQGLGRWESLCEAILGIPMAGRAESLSAGVAGSIALYQASLKRACQESVRGAKSQDYRG